ncbi:MAG: hypothetical protein K5894_15295 [Lachnospiraceae bacterium]|nr:hypothetical protein [Lachnospiraceae bacterium]
MEKGNYGYLNMKHKTAALKTGAFFGFTLLLVLLGRAFFKQYQDVFIICAIISVVPAAMTAVNMIMYLRYRTGRREVFDEIEKIKGEIPVLYDCVFTTEKESYGTNALAVINKNIILYSEYSNFDPAGLEKHLNYISKKNGHKSWTIKAFTEFDKFTARISYLREKEIKITKSDKEMLDLIKAIVL